MMAESINYNRSEQRFIIREGERVFLNFPVELNEISYSENQITRTVYIGSEDVVPWGTSFKARIYLADFSAIDFHLDLKERYAFSIKKILDKRTETSIKSYNQVITLKEAIDKTSDELNKKVSIYLITEYRRRHFISDRIPLRITWDRGTSYWGFTDRPFFLHKEGFDRIELKTKASFLKDAEVMAMISAIIDNGGRASLSKKESGFLMIRQQRPLY